MIPKAITTEGRRTRSVHAANKKEKRLERDEQHSNDSENKNEPNSVPQTRTSKDCKTREEREGVGESTRRDRLKGQAPRKDRR